MLNELYLEDCIQRIQYVIVKHWFFILPYCPACSIWVKSSPCLIPSLTTKWGKVIFNIGVKAVIVTARSLIDLSHILAPENTMPRHMRNAEREKSSNCFLKQPVNADQHLKDLLFFSLTPSKGCYIKALRDHDTFCKPFLLGLTDWWSLWCITAWNRWEHNGWCWCNFYSTTLLFPLSPHKQLSVKTLSDM